MRTISLVAPAILTAIPAVADCANRTVISTESRDRPLPARTYATPGATPRTTPFVTCTVVGSLLLHERSRAFTGWPPADADSVTSRPSTIRVLGAVIRNSLPGPVPLSVQP